MKLFLLLNDVVEKVLISIILLRLIRIKSNFKDNNWVFCGLVLLLLFCVRILNLIVFCESFSVFLIILLTTIYLKIFSDNQFLYILLIAGFLFEFTFLNSIISFDIVAVLFRIKFIEIYKSNLFYILFVIIMRFNLALFIVTINYFQKKKHVILDFKQVKQLSIIEVLIFYILIIFKKQIIIGYNSILSQFRIFFIFLFISGSIIVDLFNKERKQKVNLQNSLDMFHFEQQYYKDVLEENDEMRRIKHDFKHILLLLERSILIEDYSEIKKIADSFKLSQINQINAIITGNENLDYILNKKLVDCKNNGLSLKLIFGETDISFIEKSDLFIMLGNLLDNAIECTYNKEIPITLKIIDNDGMIVIYCSNSTDRVEAASSKCSLASTKPDQFSHGYGMSSIQMIAEKYNGNFSYRVEDHTFIAIIILIKRKCI